MRSLLPDSPTSNTSVCNPDRETHLVDVFTTLADTLVADYDVVELLQTLVDTTVDLFDVSAAGILLAEADGALDVVASTSESSYLIEVMQLDSEEGPCFDCYVTGASISVPDLGTVPDRWLPFARAASEHGFASVFAIPLRLRAETIGTLNLLRRETGDLNPRDIRAAQALADVATIGILHERTVREGDVVQKQLQTALGTRVVIEQAKGVVSETQRVSTDAAFDVLRRHARDHNARLADVARDVVERRLEL
ncbi:GAF and ANTAR domain-containing protein [Frigoribacterium sp. CFBP 8751]|uniref:GAF and ANTAR domain-containing protein n=1 Tax=Frigoribacterium sp. CFBP 8751 TaxID=2775277 RepID=UPI0018FF0D0D|nr:GAF and ANTAR domain-containing protein [Frigoribacterium sp. CFBP 8751]